MDRTARIAAAQDAVKALYADAHHRLVARASVSLPLTFTVPGPPVPKGRARGTRSGYHYTPKRTREYEEKVRRAFLAATGNVAPVWQGHLAMTVVAYGGRGDLDNIFKAAADALNGVAYGDDKQIMDARARRMPAEGNPRLEVTIARLEEAPDGEARPETKGE